MTRVSFPRLTYLEIDVTYETVLALPDSFLGGSAPRLQKLYFYGIPIPALPKLLLTTTNLAKLTLWRTPHSGYVSPGVMVACLASLIRLKFLTLGFHSPRSRPNRTSRRLPPLTRTVLPVLDYFEFRGTSEYLEELVAQIDTPCINEVHISFFNQLIFDVPLLPVPQSYRAF